MATSDQAQPVRSWRLAATGLGCALALAACGSSGSTGSASPAAGPASPSPDISAAAAAACPHLTSLRTSLTSLARLQISPLSAGQLGADLINIEKQMGALGSLGRSAGASDSAQLTAALRKITLAAQAEVGQPTPAKLAALQSALTGMKDTARPLIQQLKSACPGS